MNTAASIGPVQLSILVYTIMIIIALGVAGIIKLFVSYINMQNKRTAVKAAAAKAGSPQ